MLCDYGCGQKAKHQFKNGNWCCSSNIAKCPNMKLMGNNNPFYGKKHSEISLVKMRKSKNGKNHPFYGKKHSEKSKLKMSSAKMGMKQSRDVIDQQVKNRKLTIKYHKTKYPIFAKIEEMRYNPDKPGEKEIQVHCKNHNCPNSKEQDGWFTPTKMQFEERRRQIEYGNGGSYFYCCEECKNECPLFNLRSDPNKEIETIYTLSEYQIFRREVLKRVNNKCEYCGETATHVHHSRPKKLEPFHSLDPDYGIACCEKCHYEKGHKDECSTGNLANKVCI